jgi:hypothetical protein
VVPVGAVVRALLAVVLVAAVLAKLANGESGRAALRTWGLQTARSQRVGWIALVVVEAVIAAGLASGIPGAAEVAAVVLAGFAVAVGVALVRGRAGAPCGCFGGRSRVSRLALARAVVLAAAAASVPALAGVRASVQAWLVVGLLIALLAIATLVVALLALARELGELRLSLGPQSALSIDGEGPEIGSRLAVIDRFDPHASLAVAVFSSTTCRLCEALEPAVPRGTRAGCRREALRRSARCGGLARARDSGEPVRRRDGRRRRGGLEGDLQHIGAARGPARCG